MQEGTRFGSGVALRRFVLLSAFWTSCVSAITTICANAESSDPDAQPGSPGAIVKEVDPELYSLYRPYIDRAREIACDTCYGPKVTEGLRALRREFRSEADTEYIAGKLSREMKSESPNWDVVFVALKAAEFGMAHDKRVRAFSRQILANVNSMQEQTIEVAYQAATNLAASGEAEDRLFLVSRLSESALRSPTEGLTKKRWLLGLHIVDCLAGCPPPDDAISSLNDVIEALGTRGAGHSSFEESIMNTVQSHLQALSPK